MSKFAIVVFLAMIAFGACCYFIGVSHGSLLAVIQTPRPPDAAVVSGFDSPYVYYLRCVQGGMNTWTIRDK